jgi:hypothetical protein
LPEDAALAHPGPAGDPSPLDAELVLDLRVRNDSLGQRGPDADEARPDHGPES